MDRIEIRFVLLEKRDMLKESFCVIWPDEEIERTVNKTDANQDGQISIEEFISSDFF